MGLHLWELKNIQLSAKSEDDDVMDIPEEYISAISELDKKEIKDVVYNLEQLEEKRVIDMEIPETELTIKYLCYQI